MVRPLLVALAVSLAAAPAAHAAPDCKDTREPRTLLENQGTLESVAVDPLGRLLFSIPTGLKALDRPGGEARDFAAIEEPGGIVFDDAGNAIVGTGNSIQNGSTGDHTGPAGLVRVLLSTGATSPFATGLSMANGVVRHPDGTIYATNDFGSNVDRIPPTGGEAERGWAKVESPNGVAIDSTGRWLYVAQTFRPAAIAPVDLRDPSKVTPYVQAEPADHAAGLDGMAIDAADRLFAVANGAGELWRVAGSPPEICVVARGLPKFPDGPSAVAVGRAGTPFPPETLYVVTFDGHVYEFANAARTSPAAGSGGSGGLTDRGPGTGAGNPPATSPRSSRRSRRTLRLRVSPRRARVGRRTRFTITVERYVAPAWRPVRRARVRFAGRTRRTNRRGLVVVVRRFARPGRRVVRLRGARRVVVRVRR